MREWGWKIEVWKKNNNKKYIRNYEVERQGEKKNGKKNGKLINAAGYDNDW